MTSLPHPVESARLDETHLLQRRMTVLRLDVEAWPNMEPAMFVDLEYAPLAQAVTSAPTISWPISKNRRGLTGGIIIPTQQS